MVDPRIDGAQNTLSSFLLLSSLYPCQIFYFFYPPPAPTENPIQTNIGLRKYIKYAQIYSKRIEIQFYTMHIQIQQ